MKLYIDTNVYLDYFLNRNKSKYAEKIFLESIICKHQIIISDHIMKEILRNILLEDITFLFKTLEHKLIKIKSDATDLELAKNIPTHLADALHIILAKKSGADIIVTNNLKDFKSLFESDYPENI